jgi:hypothetical protein
MVTRSVSKHAPAYQRLATSRLLAHVPYGLMIPSESETAYETALQCTEIIDVRLARLYITHVITKLPSRMKYA